MKKTISVAPSNPRTVSVRVNGVLPRDRTVGAATPQIEEATRLAREIHQHLKRGAATKDHGLIGNLKCILDHVCRDGDPVLL